MQFKYKIPTQIEIKKSKTEKELVATNLEGHITLKLPGYVASGKIVVSSKLHLNEKGEPVEQPFDEMVEKMLEVCNSHLVSMDVKYIGDEVEGLEIKTLEDLGCFEEGREIIQTIYTRLLGGVKLGKSLGVS